ncbi:outer membrane beta-barrel family protein [Hymenobacter coalescens]
MKPAFRSLLLAATVGAATPLAAAAQPAPTTQAARPSAPITGSVADSLTRQALPFATVVLHSAADSKAVLSTVSSEQGRFVFEAVAAGEYLLTVQYLGYRRAVPVAVAAGGGPVAVLLAPDQKLLKGVTVTGAKAFIEPHADKLVLNVAASPLAAGGTAAEVLARAPGVLEQGSGYALRGKNVVVLLDGKYTNLSGEELKSMLAAMPANAIDKVEVMANPSAKYDAQGGAVINIVSTKSKNYGTNGTLTAGLGTGRHLRYNGGLSLNHRTQKLNVYGGYDHLASRPYNRLHTTRALTSDVRLQESTYATRRLHSNSFRFGADYDLSPRSSMGVLVKGLLNYRDQRGTTRSALVSGASPLQTAQVTTDGRAQIGSPAVNLYFKTKLDSLGKKTLTLNADYFGYAKDWHNDYVTRTFDATGAETGPARLLRDQSPARNAVKSASADYAQPLHGGTLEAGLKTTFTSTDNDIRWEQATAGQPWQLDPGKTNRFIYRENINAAYASYARPVRPKLNLQLGLRAEQTNTVGTSRTLDMTTRRSYLNLFPSVAVQYTKSEAHQLGLAYRRKIDRFQFGIVNPFVTYISQYSYAQGNPNIRPSYSHNFELSHTYKGMLSTALSYGHHTSVLMETFRPQAGTDVVINSYQNFRSAETLDGSLTLMKPLLGGKWSTVTTLGVTFAQLNAGSGLGAARPSGLLSTNHTLALPKGFKAEVSGMYMSPMTFGGLAFKSRYQAGFGVSKPVLKNAGTLTLNVSDVFNTQRNRYEVLAYGVRSHNTGKAESRFVRLNFSYKFGNRNVKASKRRDTGVEAEKGRMETN